MYTTKVATTVSWERRTTTGKRCMYSPTLFSAGAGDLPCFLQVSIDFHDLLVALQFRNTSKREDEYICLASLLGVSIPRSADGSKRTVQESMKELLLLLSKKSATVPTLFVFSDEQKIQIDGFRWAPLSLFNI